MRWKNPKTARLLASFSSIGVPAKPMNDARGKASCACHKLSNNWLPLPCGDDTVRTMSRLATTSSLPFLTLPDPPQSGEGALDPLGMATIGDRLADWVLPGMTARMSRPRFLTAIAVSAVVCDGLEETVAADGMTPAYLVF